MIAVPRLPLPALWLAAVATLWLPAWVGRSAAAEQADAAPPRDAPAAPGAAAPDAPSTPTTDAPGAAEAPQAPVETVTVTGEAATAASDPSAFATVLRAADWADRIASLPDLLRDVAGVQIKALGEEFATVSIRGSTAEQVVVYLDGVPLNSALGGGVNLADLPLSQIESIEIYRGITPAALGSASIGGAILLHTRDATGSHADAAATAGSFGSAGASGSIGGAGERGSWRVGFDASRSDGDFAYRSDNGTEFDPTDDRTVRRRNADFALGHLSARGDLRAARATLALSADLFARDQGVPGPGSAPSLHSRLETNRGLFAARLEAPGLLQGRLLLRAALSELLDHEAFDGANGVETLFTRRSDDRLGTTAVETGGTLVAGSHQAWSLLVAARHETAGLENRVLPAPDVGDARRDVLTATLEDEIALGGGRVVLDPSLRRETYRGRFDGGAVSGPGGDAPVDGGATTGKVGLRVAPRAGLTVRANAGVFLRIPDLTELYGDQGSIVGNPGLVPERGRTADLGLTAVRSRPQGGLREVRGEAVLFETVAENLIQYVPNAQATVVALNLSRSRIRGIEAAASFVAGRWSGGVSATHQQAVDVSGAYTRGRLLPGRPWDQAGANAGLRLGPGRAAWEFTYVGPNYTDTIDAVRLPSRYLHDLSYRLSLPHRMEATFQVKNLFDDRTVDVARFPLPGRSLQARLAWSR